MRKTILFGLLAFFGALALISPASAATINGTDYVLFARTEILFEAAKDCDPLPADLLGCMLIRGNVAVNEPTGRIRTGINNLFRDGFMLANEIVLATGAQIQECRYNVTSGADPAVVCGTVVTPLPPGTFPIVPWPVNGGPLGAVAITPGCNVNAAATPNITVAAGQTLNLAPGCYKDVRVNAGGTLSLVGGVYDMRTLRLLAGSTIEGAGVPTTTVTVAQQAVSEGGVTLLNLRLQSVNTAAFNVFETISLGNGNILDNVLLYAPTNAIHLRTGSVATNSELVANYLTIEPTRIEPVEDLCGCFSRVEKVGTNIFLSEGQSLDRATSFVLSANCEPTGGITVPATAQTSTTATLNAAGVPAGTYKVIGIFGNNGSYCNNTLVTFP
jgi:hypothetical protein